MPYDSTIAAVMAVYDALTAGPLAAGPTRPPIYFAEAPLVDGSGNRVYPPYCVLTDGGEESEQWDFSHNAIVGGSFVLEVYGDQLADADALLRAIRWNGQAPGNKAGLDFAVLSLNSPLYPMNVVPGRRTRSKAPGVGRTGQRVHMVRAEYAVRHEERA